MAETLASFIETVSPETRLRVEEELGDGFVVLRRDEAELRQAAQDIRSTEDALIELLRNSRDAGATRIYVATSLEQGIRSLTIIDNGSGVPEHLKERIFDPRVTSKLDSCHMDKWGIHGRGMALYSIKTNFLQAGITSTAPGLGCAITCKSDTKIIPEKTDQSSFPQFTLEDSGKVKISGPKNILRTAAEFALEHRSTMSVVVGTPSEVAATLMANALSCYSLAELSLRPDESVPYLDRPAFAHSPAQLATALEALGLLLSERTCRRILEGEIVGLQPLHILIKNLLSTSNHGTTPQAPRKALKVKQRPIRLTKEDEGSIAHALSGVLPTIAEKYYLEVQEEPEIRVQQDRILVSIPLVPRER